MIQISPSILAADFTRLGDQIREAEEAGAQRFHVDVMDGRFVPNISLGVPVLASIRKATRLPLEAHLMIVEPERYVGPFVEAGADTVLVHAENAPHLHRTIQQIRAAGARPGVVVNPSTPAESLSEILPDCDQVLVMTVNPGFGGQSFLRSVLPKLRRVAALIGQQKPGCDLEVDGGIDETTAPDVVRAGAGVLVAGSAIFGSEKGIAAAIRDLRAAAEPASPAGL
ncbi:MAG: ribulose-phosphate 3-epimerase [Candidatus Eisenbacteria bacterium]|nr:ribulose-phosphate 3-epimerase [Candidatus Latescibacterota bacterium]MBD3301157.1 ribulose-phosphate 3-epimerase [Candidatus Eisenbacteria bacterium]